MKWRFFKVFSLALLAVFFAFGAMAGQKDGGGGSKNIPMKAVFSGRLGDKITSDGKGAYIHQGTKSGMNSLLISKQVPWMMGSFSMTVYATTGRHMNLLFNAPVDFPPAEPLPAGCGYPYFLYDPYSLDTPVETARFHLQTFWKCQVIQHDTYTEFIRATPTQDQTILDLTAMRPGETFGVSVEMIEFVAPESTDGFGLLGYPRGAGYLLVTATDWNGDGVMDWILKTISGQLVIKHYGRADDDLPNGDHFRMSSGSFCYCGTFWMPFELKITRK